MPGGDTEWAFGPPRQPPALERSYAALLEGYIRVFTNLPSRPTPLLSVYIETHIRRQLTRIGKWLVYARSRLPENGPETTDAWLVDTKDKLDEFVSTLDAASGIGRIVRLVTVIVPPAVTTLYALLGPPNRSGKTKSTADFLPHLAHYEVTLLLAALLYVLLGAGLTFRAKRSRFLGAKVGPLDIYDLEDAVFKILGAPKRRDSH